MDPSTCLLDAVCFWHAAMLYRWFTASLPEFANVMPQLLSLPQFAIALPAELCHNSMAATSIMGI